MPRPYHSDLALPELFPPLLFLGADVERMTRMSGAERGAIYTWQEVVEFILDLAGYSSDKPLWGMRLLEPSFGSGDFLIAAIRRLLKSARRDDRPAGKLCTATRAVELHRVTYQITRNRVIEFLIEMDLAKEEASSLADTWLINGDFLLEEFAAEFDFVVGNPPYVRQEMSSAPLLTEYRRRYTTLFDRADLYVPFIEQSLV